MYSAMIAEDSKPILRNIRALIEAAGLPVEVTATASNGLEALELLKQKHTDILLTDIRMPKLDGLGLIERAKVINPRLQAVLISGYSDFDYARRALNLQAFDYLLKPVEQGQLSEVLQRLLAQLQEQQQSDRKLLEGVVAPDYLADMPLDAELCAGQWRVLLLRERPFAPQDARGWSAARIAGALKPAQPRPGGAAQVRVLPTPRPGQFLVLAGEAALADLASASEQAEHGASSAVDPAEAAVCAALEAGGMPAAALAAPQPAGLRALAAVYGKLERELRERLTVSGHLASPGRGEAEHGAPDRGAPAGEAAKLAAQAQLAELIAQRQKERFLLLLRQSLPYWLDAGARLAELERFVRFLADAFGASAPADEAAEPRGDWPEPRGDWPEPARADSGESDAAGMLFAAGSAEAFAEGLQAWAARRFDALHEPGKRGGEELHAQIDRYLRQNLYAQLSITDAAQQFHVSPSYISRIIKRYTGSTFVHHYMQLKIDEARRLLASGPDVKVKDVADALGFGDPHYFSKVFKEYAGCSPTEYKETWTEEAGRI
ncbi:response regulator [Saccharibacillus sp. CPCC 101409]|uniref:response regulator n=1 Tax=Saccharibacillus sp. CPCC 101409 TaxID=3058041 RepID=UPI0026713C04|nr:response regulator [Saccharibacillus sp. CPCC 101409]MDO3409458.1 response regulator [Saccharibacillus sp. CPCC 101409]